MPEVRKYVEVNGRIPLDEWLEGLRDPVSVGRIRLRLRRIEAGNLGDAKSLGGGLGEFRFNFGPGFRVYFGRHGRTVVCC